MLTFCLPQHHLPDNRKKHTHMSGGQILCICESATILHKRSQKKCGCRDQYLCTSKGIDNSRSLRKTCLIQMFYGSIQRACVVACTESLEDVQSRHTLRTTVAIIETQRLRYEGPTAQNVWIATRMELHQELGRSSQNTWGFDDDLHTCMLRGFFNKLRDSSWFGEQGL